MADDWKRDPAAGLGTFFSSAPCPGVKCNTKVNAKWHFSLRALSLTLLGPIFGLKNGFVDDWKRDLWMTGSESGRRRFVDLLVDVLSPCHPLFLGIPPLEAR